MLRIGQLGRLAKVSAGTIRYYERLGLMPKPQRNAAGYREYGDCAAGRVCLVQHALRFGFSLKQVKAFLDVRLAGGAPCGQVRAAGAQVLEAIDSQMAELTAARESIVRTLAVWDEKLAQTPEGHPAHLLEGLPMPGSESRTADRRRLTGVKTQPACQ